MLQGQELRKRTIETMNEYSPGQDLETMYRAITLVTGDMLVKEHVRDELRTLTRLRWERPRNDKKVAEMMELEINHIEILTASPIYVDVIESYIHHITADVHEGRKLQNYVRTALRRGASPPEAFAKKMHIACVDNAAAILETLSCYVMLPEYHHEYSD